MTLDQAIVINTKYNFYFTVVDQATPSKQGIQLIIHIKFLKLVSLILYYNKQKDSFIRLLLLLIVQLDLLKYKRPAANFIYQIYNILLPIKLLMQLMILVQLLLLLLTQFLMKRIFLKFNSIFLLLIQCLLLSLSQLLH